MSAGGHRTKRCRNIAENFNRLSRAHERYRQIDDRRTADDMSSRSLKMSGLRCLGLHCFTLWQLQELRTWWVCQSHTTTISFTSRVSNVNTERSQQVNAILKLRGGTHTMVCLFVCPSVKHVICDKTKESCAHVHSYTIDERLFIRVLWQEEWYRGDPFHLKFLAKLTPFERKCRFSSIFARISTAVRPSERSSINTNRKCTRFPLDELRTLPIKPPTWPKNAKRLFSI